MVEILANLCWSCDAHPSADFDRVCACSVIESVFRRVSSSFRAPYCLCICRQLNPNISVAQSLAVACKFENLLHLGVKITVSCVGLDSRK